MKPLGKYPDPTHVVAHLSDPHLLAGGALQYGTVDTETHLQQALTRLSRIDPAPQALVFTGDLADRAEPKAYARLREIVEPAAAEIGAKVVWTMGNHDERPAYSSGLFDEASEQPQDRAYDVAGLRIVALDSSVPGHHHGELTGDQLSWLADVLAVPAPHGTILALHHPPIPVPMLPIAEVIGLHHPELLAEVVTGTDVRAIVGGHFHFTSFSTFAGVPVSVASASCYTTDVTPVDRLVSGVDGHQSFTMLHLYDDRVVHSVVPVPDAPEVSGHPEEVREALEAMEPRELFELISRKDSPLYASE